MDNLLIEAAAAVTRLAVSARAEIVRLGEKPLSAEVVGFRDAARSAGARLAGRSRAWRWRGDPHRAAGLGRAADQGQAQRALVDAFGNPIDGKGPLEPGLAACPLRAAPLNPPMPAPGWASVWTSASGP